MQNKIRILGFVFAFALLSSSCGLVVSSQHKTEDYTPVVAAASGGDLTAVEQAIKKDPSLVKYREWDNATLLHDAVHQNHQEVAEFLLNAGADVNASKNDGVTPLHIAAQNGNIKITKLLLDKGANINARDSKGWTPLDRAKKWGHADTVEFLRLHGGRAGT